MDNAWDAQEGIGQCDSLISSGQQSCADTLCPTCPNAHLCDLACGFLCAEDGVTTPLLTLLPPGATESRQNVGTEMSTTCDRGIAFTAAATGTFTARVTSAVGSGPVTISVRAIGTALERSPVLAVDGMPHPLTVSCNLDSCTFGYDGVAAYDGDGSGFDLVLPDAEVRTLSFLASRVSQSV